MQIKDLYINPRNIVTIVPYCGDYVVGLAINGIRYTLEKWDGLITDPKYKKWQEKSLEKATEYQKQLIEEIKNENMVL